MIASAQYFDVFDIDTNEYPIMKAKFYSIDANGKQILNHTPTDFEITENGEPRDVISVSCPIPRDEPFSIVLAIDISESMDSLEIIKSQIKAFIDKLPLNGSEIAIIAFNQNNYFISDFSTNKALLKEKVHYLIAGGGTDFNAAFINPVAGSLLAMEKAKFNNRNVIIITDGIAKGNQVEITNVAISQKTRIYSLVLGNLSPDILTNISKATGGEIYNYIKNKRQLEESFTKVSKHIFTAPCIFTWEASKSCEGFIDLKIRSIITDISYEQNIRLSDEQRSKIEISPSYIDFGYLKVGEIKDTSIMVTAHNFSQMLNNSTVTNDFGNLKIIDQLPILFEKDKQNKIRLRYESFDTLRHYVKLNLEFELCPISLGITFGNYKHSIENKTLNLLFPNGSEVFYAGSDTTIIWKGISENEQVELNFSSDKGKTWSKIADSAYNLHYNWKLPKVKSNNCLVNINQNKAFSYKNIGDWNKTFGGSGNEFVNVISQSREGGYYIVGSSTSSYIDWGLNREFNNGYNDLLVIKLDNLLELEWVKTFGGNQDDIAFSVVSTKDRGLVIVGKTNSTDNDFKRITNDGLEDLFILKLLESGKIDWIKSYGELGSEYATSIIQTDEDNFIVVGGKNAINHYRGLFSEDGEEAYILKLNDRGDTLWTKQIKGNDNDDIFSVVQSDDGGIVVAGRTNSENSIFDDGNFDPDGNRTKYDAWIFKLDMFGELVWSKTIGGIAEDGLNKIIKSNDGGYIACGYSGSNDRDLFIAGNKGKTDAIIIKIDDFGNILWTKTYGGSEHDAALDLVHLIEGGYLISGFSESNDGELSNSSSMGKRDAWVFKISYDGNLLWSDLLGGTNFDEANSIIQTFDGTTVIGGRSNSKDGNLKEVINNGDLDAWIFSFKYPPELFQSDTSDAVFSIIMPEPVIQNNDIDMGQMIVGSTKDTIVSSVICNTGEAPLHVLGVDITGGDAGDFLIPRGAGDFYLAKDSCQGMMFEFTPSTLGNRTAVATIRTTIGDFQDTIHIRGVGINPVIEATAEVVNFGVFELGNGKDTTVVLVKNVGSTDINITDTRISGPDMEQFTLNTVPISYTIPAGEEKEFQLNYTAKYGGKSNTFLDFHYDGIGSPIRSLLFAEGIGGEVYPVVADAFVGEAVELGIFLGKIKPEGLSEIATNFTATVSYNSTLLAPIDKTIQVTTEDNKSYINIEGQLSEMNQIAAVPMKVGLGTAVKSGLVITEFQLYDANGDTVDYDIEPGVGEFNVLGICEEGGLRLINPNGEAVNMVVTTDGLNSNARINLTLIETGQTDLVIFDQIGNKIETVYSGTPITGQQEIDLDLSNYTNGRYYIKLTTPTITKTKIIEVVR